MQNGMLLVTIDYVGVRCHAVQTVAEMMALCNHYIINSTRSFLSALKRHGKAWAQAEIQKLINPPKVTTKYALVSNQQSL